VVKKNWRTSKPEQEKLIGPKKASLRKGGKAGRHSPFILKEGKKCGKKRWNEKRKDALRRARTRGAILSPTKSGLAWVKTGSKRKKSERNYRRKNESSQKDRKAAFEKST